MTKRKSLSKKLRFEVFKRDKFTCQYCGQSAPDAILEIDHIEPVSKGGTNDLLNLITSCKDCNQGKSNRELSDDAMIQKQKQHLDELQERREQLEMMMEWQRGLLDLDELAITELSDIWKSLVCGFYLNDTGLRELRNLVRKYEIPIIVSAMKTSVAQYLRYDPETKKATHKSVEKAWNYVGRIIKAEQRMKEKPYLRQLYYCRGILRNRLGYVNEWQAIQLMEQAYLAGASLDSIQQCTKDIPNWSSFKATMLDWAGN